jgi:hypothetical protein
MSNINRIENHHYGPEIIGFCGFGVASMVCCELCGKNKMPS